MEKRLQRREDELDVRKLQFLYGYLIDKRMYDQVIHLFTEGPSTSSGGRVQGLARFATRARIQ